MIVLGKFINLILYSSLWIALCAAAQVQLTYALNGYNEGVDIYTAFVFASTIGLYGLHRLIGINKVRAYTNEGRFAIIKQYKSHILIYTIIGFAVAAVLFMLLPWKSWIYLLAPLAISAAYVIPPGISQRRLRDFPFIKIFLLAASWSLLTTTVPLLNSSELDAASIFLNFLERFLFVFAITIPFDIRDFSIDKAMGLKTLPHLLGIKKSKLLALLLILVSAILVSLMIYKGIYPISLQWPYSIFLLITVFLISRSRPEQSDFYYSGLLDGTMLLLFLLITIQKIAF